MTIDSLLLFPGAGGDCGHHTLVALEAGLKGVPVVRRDFPYRREGRKAPDRAPKLVNAVVDDAEQAVTNHGPKLVLGGRSMGGRMCSMAVAQGLEASGLVLLSYPLHPPGKPENLRTDHFAAIRCPCLFLSGTKDPFGTKDEFVRETAAITGPVRLEWIEGQRHDPKQCDDQIVAIVADWLSDL